MSDTSAAADNLRIKHGLDDVEPPISILSRAIVNKNNKVVLDLANADTPEKVLQILGARPSGSIPATEITDAGSAFPALAQAETAADQRAAIGAASSEQGVLADGALPLSQVSVTLVLPRAAKSIVADYRTRVLANSGTISDLHMSALLASLDQLISSSAWPKIKELWVPLGEQLAGMLVKLKYPSALSGVLTHDNLVEGDYVPRVGLTGGTNRRLKSDFDPSAQLTTASAGIGVFALNETWTTSAVICGSTVGTSYYLNFNPGTSKLGSYSTPSSSSHTRGRSFQWGQFRSGNVEFGTGGRVSFSAVATASAMSGAFNVFAAGGSFYSNATVGGFAMFDAMTPTELALLDLFFKRVNAMVGRDPFAPSVNFIGDSITAGTGASTANTRWVNVFSNKYGLTINNQGLSGTTLKSPPGSGQSVYPLAANLYNKASVFYVIALGTNDAYNYDAPSTHLEDFQSAYRTALDTIKADGVDLQSQAILVSPSWPADGALTNGVTRARYLTYVEAVEEIAAEYGIPFANAYDAVLNAGGTAALAIADVIHPNDTGHAAIAAVVGTAFESRKTLNNSAIRL